jgi:copper transport protein
MRRLLALPALAAAFVALAAAFAAAPPAWGHAAYVGSEPAPGQRLEASPGRITLVFTEPLNARLARATLRPAAGGPPVPVVVRAERRRLVVSPARRLARGAYRVDWHTVSTEDGHALEGAFAFGVRAAAGAAPVLETGPLARAGWVRILARIALYATLLILVAALLLPLLVRRPRGWPVPELGGGVDTAAVRARGARLAGDLAWAAVAAAVAATVADAAAAARGVDLGRMADYLAGNAAGLARAAVVVLLAAAALLRERRPRAAAGAAVLALGAVAASGHAGSADPRVPSILNDWLHLASGALWLGGIALLFLLWWPVVRSARRATRLAVARHVLAPFGRVAAGAFAVAAATGLVSLVTQLGRLTALWETSYGRLLAVKIVAVAVIAAASAVHALHLRPRLLATAVPEPLERRHWRLWRSEPWLALAVVAAVAGLVAFPLPPRQLAQAGRAQAAVCDPCPLARPAAGELAVADSAGSQIVAAWVRRTPQAVTGTVRLLDRRGRPSGVPVELPGGSAAPCGTGCRRFRLPASATAVDVAVRERGRRHTTRLPAVWEAGASGRARRLLRRAEAAMRALRGVREVERLTSGPGTFALTEYRLRAPDRLAWRTGRDVRGVIVGERQWIRTPESPWRAGPYGSGLAFRTRSWFAWRRYARTVRLLGERSEGGRRLAELALMDEGTPVWFRLTVDTATHRVLRERMIARARFLRTRFVDFDREFEIVPPEGAR